MVGGLEVVKWIKERVVEWIMFAEFARRYEQRAWDSDQEGR